MDMQLFTPWHISSSSIQPFFLVALYDDYEGFRLLLRQEEDLITRLSFDHLFTYRFIKEADYIESLEQHVDVSKHQIYTVQHSAYLQWFQQQSLQHHDPDTITHYGIYTTSGCVDILTQAPLESMQTAHHYK